VASKSSDVRPKITLACVDCKERNYITKKNRRNDPDRMEMNKFCPRCRKHTAHRETRWAVANLWAASGSLIWRPFRLPG